MKSKALIGFTLTLLAFAAPAKAALLYDNGSPNNSGGYEMTRWLVADNFSFANPATVQRIRFWAFLSGTNASYSGEIHWMFLTNSSNNPEDPIAQGGGPVTPVNQGALAFNNSDQLQFDVLTGGVSLGAGNYWLVLHNGDFYTNTAYSGMFWQTSSIIGQTPGAESRYFPLFGTIQTWNVYGADFAFQLYDDTGLPAAGGDPPSGGGDDDGNGGDDGNSGGGNNGPGAEVPEPSTALLGAGGMALLAAIARARAARKLS